MSSYTYNMTISCDGLVIKDGQHFEQYECPDIVGSSIYFEYNTENPDVVTVELIDCSSPENIKVAWGIFNIETLRKVMESLARSRATTYGDPF